MAEEPASPVGATASADLSLLMTSLAEHALARDGALPESGAEGRRRTMLEACCLVVASGPLELGAEFQPSPLCDRAWTILSDIRPDDPPEARLCCHWLSYLRSPQPQSASEFVALANAPLWNPVQRLLYLALAHFGLRRTLSDVLPRDGPLTLGQADAWMEAAHDAPLEPDWTGRLSGDPLIPLALLDAWVTLLKAETDLACNACSEVSDILESLLSVRRETAPLTYVDWETARLAARVTAAVSRARLAGGRSAGDSRNQVVGFAVPVWQEKYLHGLACWKAGEMQAAECALRAAQDVSPAQTPVLVALGSLLAPGSPDKALAVLDCAEPTREVLVSRAALLARLEHYQEASRTLALLESGEVAGNEPARYSWASGRARLSRQERALRMALAEQGREWSAAAEQWRGFARDPGESALRDARRLFMDRRESDSLGGKGGWTAGVVGQRLERGIHQLGAVPLTGNAMFFRAVGVADRLPGRTATDFRTLLRRRSWVRAEKRAGASRLIYAGDMLMRLGQPAGAVGAYRAAQPAPGPAERLAVALVSAESAESGDADRIQKAADRARELAPQGWWPQALAALGLIAADDAAAALARVEIAEKNGAPAAFSRAVRAICGRTPVAEDDMAGIGMPQETALAVILLCGAEPELVRYREFVQRAGDEWLDNCPIEPSVVARRVLAAWCDEGDWERALEFAASLEQIGGHWAVEAAALARLRHALERAMSGELDQAQAELTRIEAAFTNSGLSREELEEER